MHFVIALFKKIDNRTTFIIYIMYILSTKAIKLKSKSIVL